MRIGGEAVHDRAGQEAVNTRSPFQWYGIALAVVSFVGLMAGMYALSGYLPAALNVWRALQ